MAKAVKPGFRLDIQGIRGFATIGVVVFHTNKDWLPGGIVGIDLFFGMSGFLIGGILLRQFESNSFSVGQFYRNRVRRLFPALMVMLTVLLCVGIVVLSPNALRELARTTISTVFFVSNMDLLHLMSTTKSASYSIPLVHTWSLAVEEQFYIFFPLLLWWCLKQGGRAFAIKVLSVLGVLSFALGSWVATIDHGAGYLLLPTRAYELFFGALFALGAFPPVKTQRTRDILAITGVVMLIGSYFLLPEEKFVPGIGTVPPLVGAMLFIHAGRDAPTIAGNWFANFKLFQIIGASSYSVYLWHWPIICLTLNLYNLHPPVWAMALAFVSSFVLGYLSYRFIEQPFIKKSDVGAFKKGGIAAMAVASFAAALYLSDGLPFRTQFAGHPVLGYSLLTTR